MNNVLVLLKNVLLEVEPFNSISYTRLLNMGYNNKQLIQICIDNNILKKVENAVSKPKSKKTKPRRTNSKLQ